MGGHPEPHLGHKEHNQGDIGGENYGERGKGEGRILLAGQDHGDRSRDEAQDLRAEHVWGHRSAGSDESRGLLPLRESLWGQVPGQLSI